jgi:hypothetical protein
MKGEEHREKRRDRGGGREEEKNVDEVVCVVSYE